MHDTKLNPDQAQSFFTDGEVNKLTEEIINSKNQPTPPPQKVVIQPEPQPVDRGGQESCNWNPNPSWNPHLKPIQSTTHPLGFSNESNQPFSNIKEPGLSDIGIRFVEFITNNGFHRVLGEKGQYYQHPFFVLLRVWFDYDSDFQETLYVGKKIINVPGFEGCSFTEQIAAFQNNYIDNFKDFFYLVTGTIFHQEGNVALNMIEESRKYDSKQIENLYKWRTEVNNDINVLHNKLNHLDELIRLHRDNLEFKNKLADVITK